MLQVFKYTKTSINIIIRDLKKYAKIFKYSALIFTIGYYIFALITKIGNFWINVVLLSLISLYSLFELITINKDLKTTKKVVKRVYKWLKIAIKAFTLGVAIYGLYTAANNVTAISIVLTTLMIIMWVLETILEIVIEVISKEAELLIAGWKKDMEIIKQPATKVGNFFRKLKGEDPIESFDIDEKQIEILEKEMSKNKEK